MHAPRGFRVHGFVYLVFMHALKVFSKLNCDIYCSEVLSKGMDVLQAF